MGNGPSQEEVDKVGYRVLGVQPNSPAAVGGLVSFFDFIVAAKGTPLGTLDSTFVDLIKSSEDQPLPLTVYNCKSHTRREIILVPSRKWPGEGMLGVTIRFDSYHDAEEHLCRVTEVEVNSPADLAGLLPDKDYLLGTAEKVFRDTDVLYEELAANLETPVEFYVYNSDSDEVRIAVVMPSDQWGGEGLLGAGVAHGFLHGLPSSCCNTIGISNIIATKSLSSPFGYNDCDASQYPYPPPAHPTHLTQHPSSSSTSSSGPTGHPTGQTGSTHPGGPGAAPGGAHGGGHGGGVNGAQGPQGNGSEPLYHGVNSQDGQYNQFNQYPLPMPPLPPNVHQPHAPIDITLKPPQRA